MLSHLHRHVRLILGLIWTSAFMLMLAHLLYGEVSLRQQAPQLLQDLTVSMSQLSMQSPRPIPI